MTTALPGFGPRTPYPSATPLTELFARSVARNPDATALINAARRVSYTELDALASRVAQQLGAVHGMIVGLYAHRSVEAVAGLLGILKAGAAYLPIDPGEPPARVVQALTRAGSSTVLAAPHLSARVPPGSWRVVALHTGHTQSPGAPGPSRDEPTVTVSATDPAYVMFTSGSTGEPKAVCVPHRAVSRLIINTDYVELTAADVLLHTAPLSFDASTFEIWGALLTGAALAIVPSAIPSVRELGVRIAADRASVAWLPTALFREVVRHDVGVLAPLRTVITGGEVASPEAMQHALSSVPGLTVINGYGPTEATTFTTMHVMPPGTRVPSPVPIGRPIANTAVYVLDAELRPMQAGEIGELYIGGDGLALGYLGDPDATERSFVASAFGRLYRTGDLARVAADGLVEFAGRVDRQLKVHGFRVEPVELEAEIRRMPGVRDTVVLPYDSPTGRQLVAYVVGEWPDPGSASDVAQRVSEWGAIYEGIIYDELLGLPTPDPQLNTQGWRSSYDGRPIPLAQMREQVDQTIERIMSSRPRRVLEVGCGTGMLLFRLIRGCERYVGTDFSETALTYVRRELADVGTACEVSLHRLEACDLGALGDEQFDAVVLNSIVQHFPTSAYLRTVLAAACDRVVDCGVVFVGDVRAFSALRLLHTSIALARTDPDLTIRELRDDVTARIAAERELCLDPEFFVAADLPRCVDVRVDAKRGSTNELTLFRYDARVVVDRAPAQPVVPATTTWDEACAAGGIDALLDTRSEAVQVSGIPDPRCAIERAVWSSDLAESATVSEVVAHVAAHRPQNMSPDPDQLRALADERDLDVQIAPSAGRPTHWDATFAATSSAHRAASPVRAERGGAHRDWRRYANDPLSGERRRRLAASVLDRLRTSMPSHLVPARVVVLDAIPLTTSGKVDTARLSVPRERWSARSAPERNRTGTVGRLQEVCEELLATPIAADDNVFDRGADSLTVIQLVARLEAELDVRLSPVTVYEHRVVSALAECIDSAATPEAAPTASAALADPRADAVRRVAEREKSRRRRDRPAPRP